MAGRKISGHGRRLIPLGPRIMRNAPAHGWRVVCQCGWADEGFPNITAAHRAYSEHLSTALPVCKHCGNEKPWDEICHVTHAVMRYLVRAPTCFDCWIKNFKELLRLESEGNSPIRDVVLSRYKLTRESYAKLLAEQGGVCGICGKESVGALCVDHDHDREPEIVVRGLLCTCCNAGLGHFFHSPALLRRAADYLEKWGKK